MARDETRARAYTEHSIFPSPNKPYAAGSHVPKDIVVHFWSVIRTIEARGTPRTSRAARLNDKLCEVFVRRLEWLSTRREKKR
jgi:hypothetical protein